MSEPLDKTRLEEIEARVEKTYPRPWYLAYATETLTVDRGSDGKEDEPFVVVLAGDGWLALIPAANEGIKDAAENADFIAEARDDVPDLCAALRKSWSREAEKDERIAELETLLKTERTHNADTQRF